MANLTTNKDVDYIQKDFNSVVDAVISFANVNFGSDTSANRLWTNFNADSFSRNWLEIVAFISDVFFFYFDNQATQTYLQTATVRSAIRDIAKQFGFTPATASSASGVVSFTVTSAVTIPRGFRVQSSNGAEFFVTNDIIASTAGTVNGTVLQGQLKNEQFSAEGVQNEEIELQGPNVIRDLSNLNPQDITPQVTVSGNDYTLVTSFIRHDGTDQPAVTDSLGNVIGGGGRVFTLDERDDGTPFIRFGDGVFGRKLNPGETVTVNYRSGGGSTGNVAEQTITTLVDSLAQVSSVTNETDFTGGADEQSIEQLRELIPASLRTLERAVAEQDYSDILTSNFSEVFAASTETNNTDAGVDLNVYVVPQGTGIGKISDNTLLKDRLVNFLDRRKMVTVQFQIEDAFGIDMLFSLEVFINNTASRTTVSREITNALQGFFNLETGGVDGTGIQFSEEVLLTDIDNLIRNIDGIERFEIKRLSYRPRLEENIVGLTTDYSSSEIKIFDGVKEREWLVGASGLETETSGTVLFDNSSATGFSYNSGTGLITYSFPVDLEGIASGDLFRDGASLDFTILAVDVPNSTVTISEGQTVNTTAGANAGGSIRNGPTDFQSFKVFKKQLATATNLSVDTITDNDLDLSIASGTASTLSARTLLDNDNVFVPGEFSTGDFFLVDAADNIWEIEENSSNTLKTSVSAVNDAAVTSVTAGDYKIVNKLTSSQVVFQGNIFNIQYNTEKTITSVGAQFSQIGTIGDSFSISEEQNNKGNLGVNLDLISFDSGTGQVRLNSSPNLEGISSEHILIDSDGQLFNIVSVDNVSKPSVFYESINQNSNMILQDSGLGTNLAQGFQVSETDTYAIVSANLKSEGNIVGNITASIVDDDGTGLPDLSSVVAASTPVDVTTIDNSNFEKVVFSFTTPPILTSGTQYHLVLIPDAGYTSAEQSGTKSFDNSGLVNFSYNSSNGIVQFSSSVNLQNVEPGHFFQDSSGALFSIKSVSNDDDQIIIDTGLTVDDNVPSSSDDGSVIVNDRVLVGIDTSSSTYSDGEFSSYDGSQWSNSTQGPSSGSFTDSTGSNFSEGDLIFSVEGTKSITIDSNLTPTMGSGATASTRYYDDNNEVSFVLGVSNGSVTSASDVDPTGQGTVASVPNSPVDNFVFRTSRFTDDVVNLRFNEIPQVSENDIKLQIFGGVQ